MVVTVLTYLLLALTAIVIAFLIFIWLGRLAKFALQFCLLMVFISISAFWWNGLKTSAENQPLGLALVNLEIGKDNESQAIGAIALNQNQSLLASASEPHIGFTKVSTDLWRISNISATKRLSLRYDEISAKGAGVSSSDENSIFQNAKLLFGIAKPDIKRVAFNSNRLLLQNNDEIVSQGALRSRLSIKFRSINLNSIEFTYQGENFKLSIDSSNQLSLFTKRSLVQCPEGKFESAIRYFRTFANSNRERTIVRIGGEYSCQRANSIYLDSKSIDFAGLTFQYIPDLGFAVVNRASQAVFVRRAGSKLPLNLISHPSEFEHLGKKYSLESFIAGHTRYNVKFSPKDRPQTGVLIVPVSGAHRITTDKLPCGDQAFATTNNQIARKCEISKPASTYWWPKVGERNVTSLPESEPGSFLTQDSTEPVSKALQIGIFSTLFFLVVIAIPLKYLSMLIQVISNQSRGLWFLKWLIFPFKFVFSIMLWIPKAIWMAAFGKPSTSNLRNASGGRLLNLVGTFARINLFRIILFSIGIGVIMGSTSLYYVLGNDLLQPHPPQYAFYIWLASGVILLLAKNGDAMSEDVIFIVWTGIVAFGHVAMVSLSLQMEETRFLRFSDDTSLVIGASGGAIICLSQLSPGVIKTGFQWFSSKRLPLLFASKIRVRLPWIALFGLGGAILLLWLAWIMFGSETGIAGILQPSEAIKTLFAIAMGILLTFVLDQNKPASYSFQKMGYSLEGIQGKNRFPLILLSSVLLFLMGWLLFANFYLALIIGLLWMAVTLAIVNPFWRGFAIIGSLIAIILLAPVSRSDMSPALIIVFTTVFTFAICSLMHILASLNNRAVYQLDSLWSIGAIPTRPRQPSPIYRRGGIWLKRQWRTGLPFLSLPYIWLILLPVALVSIITWWSSEQLRNPEIAKTNMIGNLGTYSGFLDVPIKRGISWIEFNAVAKVPGEISLVEFADTALQVDLSRKAIATSACNIWGADGNVLEPVNVQTSDNEIFEIVLKQWQESVKLLDRGVRWTKASLLGRNCNPSSNNEVSLEIATKIFAIQSDFASTWLISYFGRDGALIIAMLQIALVTLMLFASFLMLRWHPGMSEERPAANMASFTIAAFAIMLALQWIISWANAFGNVPVMGQPATFLSHGRSHFLFFGLPAIAFTMCALRMRTSFTETRSFWHGQKHRDIPSIPITTVAGTFLRKLFEKKQY
ncbi:MAG: hypothetical protein AAF423_01235 [Pseudomonadota bacterium]